MKALLWKDFWNNGRMLLAVAIFLAVPYAIVVAIGVAQRTLPVNPESGGVLMSWGELIVTGCAWSLVLCVLSSGFIAGNAVAGERADRSAEFTAYLPIARDRAIASKALVAGGAWLGFVLINVLIGLVALWIGDETFTTLAEAPPTSKLVASVVLIFGVSWLLSVLARSPSIAAATGIGSAIMLLVTLELIENIGHFNADHVWAWYSPLGVVFGVGCFAAGVLIYVRRAEA